MSQQILKDIISDFQPEKFIRFFRTKNNKFRFPDELLPYEDYNFRDARKIAEAELDDGNFIVCSFLVKQPLSERSGKKAQYELGKKVLKEQQSDAGIFIFYDESGNFRFSLIYTDYFGPKRKFSYFKRFTYFVSPKLTNKTFLQQVGEGDFSSLQKIKEAFSVEPVTKQFYEEIQTWYFWAKDNNEIKFPEDYKYSYDPKKCKEIRNATSLIRLITRIIFIWFLKEKGLVPETLFDINELEKIVKNFGKDENYYNTILQNLFFATLNQKIEDRGWAEDKGFPKNKSTYGVKTLFRYEDKFLIDKKDVLKLFKDIPFLNGGLFDCLDKEDEDGRVVYIDGFSRNPKKQAKIPDYFFFQKEEIKIDLSEYELGKNKSIRGLIDILKSYNFTIDENTPIDQEVALDPELLGKVFENLLAAYNPETATTARKATGSYYTPREIVEYMVEEALLEYLKNYCNRAILDSQSSPWKVAEPSIFANRSEAVSTTLVDRIRLLLSYSEEVPEFSPEERQRIIEAIDNIKILDPACGSGAFPMGILHKLVHMLQRLDSDNKYWYELQYQKALKASEEVFREKDKSEREQMLKEINDVFDESINYPDYARKLYLIENCIYGVDIQPIAVQISKLRFFISLVLDQKVDRTKENFGIRALPNLETKFVAANTLIGIERPQQLQIRNPEIVNKEKEIKELRHRYFTAKTRKEKLSLQVKDKKLREELSSLLIHDGWGEQSARKISSFDLFDQNASADWFDSEWMFGITDGFNIVIGNPPYGAHYPNEHKKYFSEHYYIAKKGKNLGKTCFDTFALFIEKGFHLLKNKGHLIYIVPISVTSSDSMERLHKLLENNCSLIKISSYAVRPKPIFLNSVVNTSIIYFIKDGEKNKYILTTKMYRKNDRYSIQDILSNLKFIGAKEFKLRGRYPKISYEIEKQILKKLFSIKTKVGDLIQKRGSPIFYRTTGGRYFKVITNYSTNSTKEKDLYFDKKLANVIGALLSSNLFFWYYQIYSNNLDLKSYEIESFPIPLEKFNNVLIKKIEDIYSGYLKDIERNARIRYSTRYANVDNFKEYKVVKSKALIDKIDDIIGPLYGLTKEEIEFIKNYDIEFRISEEDENNED